MGVVDKTWHEVLKKAGFNGPIAESLIGFISWEEDKIYPRLGHEMNDVLNNYEGKLVAHDVHSSKYHHQGILFLNKRLPEEISNKILDAILDYEYDEVYNLKQPLY
ncbi:hypothetical protein [Geosporobacter ferrireducens]|uniref:Uncharacterized protein n=1 Tax=Geosporobacter ferrireducens TaxID=1424294 RepID=A0A1D8GNT7_9FIRM|nr:hypothetical protein [Geosporobacter ferrireducens]AOT72588.1 hypothetical protein Gferi_25365 [Geosporobacter ferrireducens]MTI54988.1 hypothetical protein [Geosporobacter ferrireducens]